MRYEVRPARPEDAAAISEVILSALRESNAKDYSADIIKRVEESFSADAVQSLMGKRTMFVATSGVRILGTASLEGGSVRTVFVAPSAQGIGVGRRLMEEVVRTAREANIWVLAVPSSVTAEQFYANLGFIAVRDSYHGEERTIIMERQL
ncbi:GNAT family N-acetyltransferase (plasmid) [Rhizobium leguminosarum]|nr:GNAT family N-acetyltransferase [Rhizobium leguminosarum]TAV41694.1 GNAT family N-acetyltransferase [Rhizobium leguminosarum]TAX02117.1 GNAT family N-acetyltransferase [Rhizobium leguminosarum]TAX22918.1 GNAT family N-acetyltransferase [Rhizobium leguminosarum]TAX46152.1 GNAT family N-acetyltransferase [Rhizobium leguminosarum]TAX46702.1 GNAT family N-acetyltransferase [Rhizobium leguminosarum]